MDFKQLLKYCKKNDRRAQEQLFYRYSGYAMSVAVRYAGHGEQAKDIVQESMIRVFRHLDSFNQGSEAGFKAWLRKITAREAIRWLKKQNRYTSLDSVEMTLSFEISDIDDTFLREELLKYLHQLPDGYRMVFNLFVIEEYSHKEISEMLGITESASRSQLSRARAQLQSMIKENKQYEKVG